MPDAPLYAPRGERKGRFLLFEGNEGVGKTTQVKIAGEYLKSTGFPYVTLREPGGTPLGDDIRAILLNPASKICDRAELLLFNAARAQIIEAEIRPALLEGKLIVLDRFYPSTIALQGYGRFHGEPTIVEKVRSAIDFAVEECVPDRILYLSMQDNRSGSDRRSAEAALIAGEEERRERMRRRPGGLDRMEKQSPEFLHRVKEGYEQAILYEEEHNPGVVERVDARGTEAEVFARIKPTIDTLIAEILASKA